MTLVFFCFVVGLMVLPCTYGCGQLLSAAGFVAVAAAVIRSYSSCFRFRSFVEAGIPESGFLPRRTPSCMAVEDDDCCI